MSAKEEALGSVFEISVEADGEAAEAICELFERYGGGAVVEIQVRADGRTGKKLKKRRHWVRTYLPVDDIEARRKVEVGLWHLGMIHPIPDASVKKLAEANWAEAWKEHYAPLRLGKRFLVVPSWIDVAEANPAEDDLILRLDPGMAFGTGLHPTTQLCLESLEECLKPGETVLDVGTGSGILAIGAALLGAGQTLGVDIDPRAAKIAAENARLNGVTIETMAGEISQDAHQEYDLVIANILAGTITEIAASLAAHTRPGGLLISSGILDTQAADVATALEAAGFEKPEMRQEGDWMALLARKIHVGPPVNADGSSDLGDLGDSGDPKGATPHG